VLTACGIETFATNISLLIFFTVATVLTACGIETGRLPSRRPTIWLQQCLPLAVLKQNVKICIKRIH